MIDYYDLHQEMVELKSDGDGHEVKLCTSCVASIKKNDDPPQSIKAGVDFGSYHRIGLEPLSLAERNIISIYRHYSQVVKIESNSGRRSTPRAASRDARLCSTTTLREFVRSFLTRTTSSLTSVFTSWDPRAPMIRFCRKQGA